LIAKHFFMKISILLITFVLCLTSASAQQSGKIRGSVLQQGKPAEGATVSLLRAKDSATVKLSIASKEGAYSFRKSGRRQVPGFYYGNRTTEGFFATDGY
jgi:hypothetical protein